MHKKKEKYVKGKAGDERREKLCERVYLKWKERSIT